MFTKKVTPKIDYKKYGIKKGENDVYLQVFVSEPCTDEPIFRPAVIILPGGGYNFLSPREAEPVALDFSAHGFATFVLWYSVEPGEFPSAMLELAWSVNYVRENAKKWNIIPDKIAVCGFSAGGHLGASVGTMWNCGEIREILGFKNGEARPDGMILCYPVITTGESAEINSIRSLICDDPDKHPELKARLSLENNVDNTTPPAFIWHTTDDNYVSSENSLLFALALRRHGVPFELHLPPHGGHGLALCDITSGNPRSDRTPGITGWVGKASEWFYNL